MTILSERCPVCAMPTALAVSEVEYHGMRFRFCSDQCRQMFLAHPSLYTSRLGQKRREVIKQRTIELTETVDAEVARLLIPYLQEMMGIREVALDGRRLSVVYDLTQVTGETIEMRLLAAGLELDDGWVKRFLRRWMNYKEQNELENLAAKSAACCNRPPSRLYR